MENENLINGQDKPIEVNGMTNNAKQSPITVKKLKIIKGILVGVILSFLILNDSVTWFLPTETVSCLDDGFADFLKPVNTFFVNNSGFKKGILITVGILMDLQMLTVLAIWTMKGKSWRYPFTLICNYLLAFILK